MIERRKNYERYEDMSADGKLWMLLEDSGDIIITVLPDEQNPQTAFPTIEFCTLSNDGGQSPNVLEALMNLMEAIQKDNKEYPQKRSY